MADPRADTADVTAKAAAYCQALWSSDVGALKSLFHPRANLYGTADGDLAEYSGDAWFDIVSARAAGDGDAPYKVISVSVPTPDLAVATVDCAARGAEFTDVLNFVKLDGEWRVIAKLFHAHGHG